MYLKKFFGFVISVITLQVNSQRARPFSDDICTDDYYENDRLKPDPENCNQYFDCNDYDEHVAMECPEETPIFDTQYLECGDLKKK